MAQSNPDPLEAKVDAMMNLDVTAEKDENAVPKPVEPSVQTAPPVPHTHVTPKVAATQSPMPPTPVKPTKPDVTPPAEIVLDEAEIQPLQIDTPETDAAIKDIVTLEADEVLAAQDAGIEAALTANEANEPEDTTHRGHPLFWTFIVALIVIAVAAAIVLTSPGLSPSFIQ